MKTIYTILFIVDSTVLALLYYFLLTTVYTGHHPFKMMADIAGIIFCIAVLTYLLAKYIKLPPAG